MTNPVRKRMRRQRWQHDVLDKMFYTSDEVNADIVRDSNKRGNHRPHEDGNLITSRDRDDTGNKAHPDQWPIIDLDLDHVYVRSRTEGHGHLYLNKKISYDALHEILTVLVKHGIVGKGNLAQLEVSGHVGGRLPHDFDDRRPFYDRSL